jgi:hypothetical protein
MFFRFCLSLRKRMLTHTNLDGVMAVHYGNQNEAEAIKEYCKYGASVQESGTYVYE